MRLIDADALMESFNKYNDRMGGVPWDISAIEAEIEDAPTIDAVPVVRCKDCAKGAKRHTLGDGFVFCYLYDLVFDDDGFCSCAERRETDGNNESK